MLFLYFLIFILIGLFLNVLRGYDLFTISLLYVLLSVVLYFINIYAVVYVVLFFAIAEGITLVFNKKHEKRNYLNIIGNCLSCILFLLIGFVFVKIGFFDFSIFILAGITSITAAFADTLSSEIGKLSRTNPILITNFKRVERGTEGGITVLGITAAILASFISFVYFYTIGYNYTFALVIFIGGIFGSLIDSVIGATIERAGIFNNNHTNFLATFLTGCFAILLYILII
jgi:uncharacterized protein (TIGR00297 family)